MSLLALESSRKIVKWISLKKSELRQHFFGKFLILPHLCSFLVLMFSYELAVKHFYFGFILFLQESQW